ncbi:MAG: tetratricopeptide repeat protein [Candidatus Sulfotelmatobacter sp.]
MQRGLLLCLLVVLSAGLWAQDAPKSPPPSPSPSSTSTSREPSAAERNPFPEDESAAAAESAPKPHNGTLEPPRSDRVRVEDLGSGTGDSSSKDTQVDLSPPSDDAKTHPQSSAAVADAEAEVLSGNGVSEFHTWDPHKAAKSVEVGDFYFKRRNYRAAEERYREALRFKDNDAIATIRLAICLEKLGILDDARAEYESYLKILPHGPQAGEAQKAIGRLKVETAGPK